jgi:protein involved in polysaccharide export with SLBB domain
MAAVGRFQLAVLTRRPAMRGIARPASAGLEWREVLHRLILAGGMAILFVGCATPRPPQSNGALPKPISVTTSPYVMATLDRGELTLSNGERVVVEVSQDGNIVTPNGSPYVRGLSREAFEKLLRKNFPGVAKIDVIEFRPDEITVLGEVFHQIHTTMGGGPMRVMDGIASANGFTPLANKRRVKLVRQNAGIITVYELDLRSMMLGRDFGQNLLLQPGDVITVPRNFL